MKQFFVTGTDTDAGKTTVSCAILRAAVQRQIQVCGYKAAESGCPKGQMGPDTIKLAKAAKTEPLCSYSFSAPVAPAHAAALENQEISLRTITSRVTELSLEYELLLVEGAGGFLVPLSKNETVADLAQRLEIPLIVIAANRLGAINHSLLTIEAIAKRDLQIAAFVLCDTQAQPTSNVDSNFNNAQQIQDYGGVVVHSFPYCSTPQQELIEGNRLLDFLLKL